MTLTWLGQAGFLVEAHGTRVLIDPWGTPHEGRLIPDLDPSVAEDVDFVLVTHEHLDHLDLPYLQVVAGRSPGARLVLPEPIREQADGLLETQPVRPGDTVRLGPLTVEVTPSVHGVTMEDAYTSGDGRFVGYVVRGAGPTLYHAGDTLATPDVIAALVGKGIEVALLPINGRDAFRERVGIIGNIGTREAVALAREIGARMLIPYHWDGFAGNTERPGLAADDAAAAGGLHVLVLARGVPFEL